MIGIDISDHSIKIVQLRQTARHSLQAHCMQPIPPGAIENGVVQDAALLKQTIEAALQSCRIPVRVNDTAVASIPEMQSFVRVVEIPNMQPDEIGEAVQWEVAQHIPFGLDNVYIDWQPLRKGHQAAAGKQEVLVGAAQKKVVDPLFEVLRTVGLDLAAFELESQALVRSLISEDLRYKQGILLVDLGGSATNVVIHDHGALRFTASLQKGSDQIAAVLSQEDRALLETSFKESGQNPDIQRIGELLLPALAEMVAEVRGIVEFYNSIDAQHEVREIMLTGGGSNLPGIEKAFLKYFDNVHMQRGNPWANILAGQDNAKPPLELKESVRYATALGLALRPRAY